MLPRWTYWMFAAPLLLAIPANGTMTENCNEEFERGKTLSRAGHYQDAERILAGVLACFDSVGDNSFLGNINTELAISVREQGRLTEAMALFEQARKLFDREPANIVDRASALNNVASVYQARGDAGNAESMYAKSIELWKQAGNDPAGYVRTLTNLASLWVAHGDFQKAESLLIEAQTRSAQHPRSVERAGALNQLGTLYDRLGRPEAEGILRESLTLREALSGPVHMETAIVLSNLGHVLSAKRQYGEAERFAGRAYQTCETLAGKTPTCASMLNNLACIKEKTGRVEEAEAELKEVIAAYGPSPSTNLGALAAVLNNLARLNVERRQFHDGEQFYSRALNILDRMNGGDRLEKAAILTNLGALRLEQHRLDPAEEAFKKALALDEALAGPANWRVATDCTNLAIVAERRKRFEEANDLLQRAIEIGEKAFGRDSRQVAHELCNLAELRIMQKRFVPAVDLFGRAFEIFGRDTGMKAGLEVRVLNEYAFALRQVQNFAEAEKVATRAMTLQVRTALGKPTPGEALLNSAR